MGLDELSKADGLPPDTLKAMLLDYCLWVNRWAAATDDDPHVYEPQQFTVTDEEANLYGEYTHIATYFDGWYRVEVWQVYDGDDGGPTVLTGYFETIPGPGLGSLWYLASQFDTMMRFIMEDGELVGLPEVKHSIVCTCPASLRERGEHSVACPQYKGRIENDIR